MYMQIVLAMDMHACVGVLYVFVTVMRHLHPYAGSSGAVDGGNDGC